MFCSPMIFKTVFPATAWGSDGAAGGKAGELRLALSLLERDGVAEEPEVGEVRGRAVGAGLSPNRV